MEINSNLLKQIRDFRNRQWTTRKSHRQHVRGACLRWYHTRRCPIRIGPGNCGTKFSLYGVNYITGPS